MAIVSSSLLIVAGAARFAGDLRKVSTDASPVQNNSKSLIPTNQSQEMQEKFQGALLGTASNAGGDLADEAEYREFAEFFRAIAVLQADPRNHLKSSSELQSEFLDEWAKKFTDSPYGTLNAAMRSELMRLCKTHYVYACHYFIQGLSRREIGFFNRFVNGPNMSLDQLPDEDWQHNHDLRDRIHAFMCRDGIAFECSGGFKKEDAELLALEQSYCDDGNGEYCYEAASYFDKYLSDSRKPASLGPSSELVNQGFELMEKACSLGPYGCFELLEGPWAKLDRPLSQVALRHFDDRCHKNHDWPSCLIFTDAKSGSDREEVADTVRGYCRDRNFSSRTRSDAELSVCQRLKEYEPVDDSLWKDIVSLSYFGDSYRWDVLSRHVPAPSGDGLTTPPSESPSAGQ